MLLQFTVKNYKVFKDSITFSMLASNYDKATYENDNVHIDNFHNLRILRSAVIYGANASGKSKLLEAVDFFKYFVRRSSAESQMGDPIGVDPFRLNVVSENAPSEFEIIFLYQSVLYRYGFEVNKQQVLSEWLYHKPKTKEVELFYREGDNIQVHQRQFNKGRKVALDGMVRNNALLLSVAAQFNDEIAIEVVNGINQLKLIHSSAQSIYEKYTKEQSESSVWKLKILSMLKAADVGIDDYELETMSTDSIPNSLPNEIKDTIIKDIENRSLFYTNVKTRHKKYDENGNWVGTTNFVLNKDESEGTKKFFAISGPIIDVLENGDTLFIDELDSKMHPNLVKQIVLLFNSKEVNKKNAQLIFNTHNTNLLSDDLFRRDQVWFVQKNRYGEGSLYSLSDFKSTEVSKREPFEENYIQGKYGAVPYLNSFNTIHEEMVRYHRKDKEK